MAKAEIVVSAVDRTKGAFGQVERGLSGLQNQAVSVASKFALVGAAIGAAVSAIGFKAAVDAADDLAKLSQRTGVTVADLSSLQLAADLSGASLEDVGKGFRQLSVRMVEAAGGSKEAKAAFDAIGVSVRNSQGNLRSADDVFAEISGRFAGFADGAGKAAIANEIFGRSGTQLIPLLNQLAGNLDEARKEARDLGVVIESELATAAEKFNDDLDRLATVSKRFGLSLARELLPVLNEITNSLINGVKGENTFFDTIASGAATALEAITVLGANIKFVIEGVGREIGAIAAQLVALGTLDIKGFNAISEAVKEDGVRARAELDEFEKRVLGARATAREATRVSSIGPPAPPGLGRPDAPIIQAVGGASKQKAREFEDFASKISQSVANLVKENDIAKLGELTAQLAELDKLAAAGLDPNIVANVRAKLLPRAEDFGPAIPESVLEDIKRFNDLLAATPTAKLEESRKDMQLLADAFLSGKISTDQFNEAAQSALGTLPEDAEKAKDAIDELGLSFQSALEDAIVSGKGLGGVLKGLEQDILRIATRKLITEPLSKSFTGLLKGLFPSSGTVSSSSGLGGLLSSASKLFSGFFADGGFIKPGTFGIVGEGGPELAFGGNTGLGISPISTSQVDNSQRASIIDNRTLNIGQGVSRAEVAQALSAANAQLLSSLSRDRDRGSGVFR